MIRVLQVYPQLNNAGTEKVIMSLYENIDRDIVQFDFLVEREGELDKKIKSMGAEIHYVPNEGKRAYYKVMLKFFSTHSEYSIVHTHTHAAMGIVLKAAKKSGVPTRVAHSHNARNDLPKYMWFIKGLTSIGMERVATKFFACSGNAAKWLFPHKVKQTETVYNGIPVEKFLFNEKNRKELREELGFSGDTPVFIHVGRFARQKNHDFLIDILAELDKQTAGKARALLIGTGPLEDAIREKVTTLGISEKVVFLGNQTNVEKWMSAGDVFLFPSLHEGLGIVAIEAQASGLSCIASDAVPEEAELGIGLLKRLSLSSSVAEWATTALKAYENRKKRSWYAERILESNYNIKNVAKKMQQFYLEKGTK